MVGEFDVIKKFFSKTSGNQLHADKSAGVMLGVADDCAIFQPSPAHQIATSMDLLLEGRHFFADVDPYSLGHKTLAVNLSDLSAMGAKPIGCLLGLALPSLHTEWLAAFSQGFYDLSERYACPLIGGDTTRSAQGIALSVTVFGEVQKPYLQRSMAQIGDDIWLSGELGAAHIALQLLLKQQAGESLGAEEQDLLEQTRVALEKPIPRVELGQALHQIAHAMLDISDGLMQDLRHILEQSQVAAVLEEAKLPVSPALHGLPSSIVRKAVLGGGDVYELCFTASPSQRERLRQLSAELSIPLTRIGTIRARQTDQTDVQVLDRFAQAIEVFYSGFDHFS